MIYTWFLKYLHNAIKNYVTDPDVPAVQEPYHTSGVVVPLDLHLGSCLDLRPGHRGAHKSSVHPGDSGSSLRLGSMHRFAPKLVPNRQIGDADATAQAAFVLGHRAIGECCVDLQAVRWHWNSILRLLGLKTLAVAAAGGGTKPDLESTRSRQKLTCLMILAEEVVKLSPMSGWQLQLEGVGPET